MFESLGEKTLYIFAACNAITIPMVWALYPETNQRTLEEIDLLFASDSIWNWEAERNFKNLQDQMSYEHASGSTEDLESASHRKPNVTRDMSLHVEDSKL